MLHRHQRSHASHPTRFWGYQLRQILQRLNPIQLLPKFWRYLAIAGFALWLCLGSASSFARTTPAPATPDLLSEPTPSLPDAATPLPEPVFPVAQSLIDQGRDLYDAGRFVEAADRLQQAISTYANQGDELHQAIALSNLALTYYQLGFLDDANRAIATSLDLLRQASLDAETSRSVMAQTLLIQGQIQFAQGDLQTAYDTWTIAETHFDPAEDWNGILASRINQAQALQDLGFYQRAIQALQEVNQRLNEMPDSQSKVVALRSLGDALRLSGDLGTSRTILMRSQAIAESLGLNDALADTLLSLGNTLRSQANEDYRLGRIDADDLTGNHNPYQTVLNLYQQAADLSTSPITQVQSYLNQLSLLLDQQRWSETSGVIRSIQTQLSQVPLGRTRLYHQIDFAHSLIQLKQVTSQNHVIVATPDWLDIAELLSNTVQQAEALGDVRSQAYAIGTLGHLYEITQQWDNAANLTQQALLLTQTTNASDIVYLWQWQQGRILKQEGENQQAIVAYSQAIDTLKTIRSTLVAPENRSVQFSFREQVEPVYRQLVDLLLQTEGNYADGVTNLEQARNVLEDLQVAELNNFFRSNCLNVTPVEIDEIDTHAAVIYPIILDDRLAVILALPNPEEDQPRLYQRSTPVSRNQIESTITALNPMLRSATAASSQYLPLMQDLYNWLVAPFEHELAASSVETLVFVPDGMLQSIPMAVLHDGNQYLMQRYAIAMTPGLQLVETRPIQSVALSALKAGLSELRPDFPDFPPLDNVPREIAEIQQQIPSGQVLLNETFTQNSFREAINAVPFPVVHLATHGQFSSNLEDTFILTWDGVINVSELQTLLQAGDLERESPVELLVMSACQTAAGDPRSALGLAGIAVGSGARSTIATLWQVDDEATQLLMQRFYQEVASSTVSKAEALRRAQSFILQIPSFNRPRFWAPFVLVGNWL